MSEIEATIRRYLSCSAGNCNHPTDHTIRCFIGMIEGGECNLQLFRKIGGEWLVDRIQSYAKEIGSEL